MFWDIEQIFCVYFDCKERRKLCVVFVVVKKSSTGFILYSLGDLNRMDMKRGWKKCLQDDGPMVKMYSVMMYYPR